jgi:hypothetical protein
MIVTVTLELTGAELIALGRRNVNYHDDTDMLISAEQYLTEHCRLIAAQAAIARLDIFRTEGERN